MHNAYIGGHSVNNIKCVVVHNDLGPKNRTTRLLQVFCRVTGFTSDFLSFIVTWEHIRFFLGAIHYFETSSALAEVCAVLSATLLCTLHAFDAKKSKPQKAPKT